jgi:hypothetical protein
MLSILPACRRESTSVAKPAVDQDTKDTLDHVLQSSGKLLQASRRRVWWFGHELMLV